MSTPQTSHTRKISELEGGPSPQSTTGPRTLRDASRAAVLTAIGIDPSKDLLQTLNLPRCVQSYLTKEFNSDDFFINHDDVVPEDIQAGIYKAVCKLDKSTYILRLLKPSELDGDRVNALKGWEKVRRDHTQRCLRKFRESDTEIYVLEYVRRLDEIISQAQARPGTRSAAKLNESIIWYLMHTLSRELLALEDEGIPAPVCADLQPNKVGFAADGRLKLANGVLEVEDDGAMDNLIMDDDKPLGVYTPPEVVIGEEPTDASLIWRLGCLLHESASLRPAYAIEDAENMFEVMNDIVEGNMQPLEGAFSQDLKAMITQCLSLEVSQRPDLKHIEQVSAKHVNEQAATEELLKLL